MSTTPEEIRIQLRRDTAAGWVLKNPILAPGEPGWDTTNKRLKMGTGARWTATAYSDGSYLFLDSQWAGEKFRFYLPAGAILYRLDHSRGWRLSHNATPSVDVATLRGGQLLQAGLYEAHNASTGPALLTFVLVPQDTSGSGVFEVQQLGSFEADRPNLYEKKLALVIGQANAFAAGQALTHTGAGWAVAAGEAPVLGICEFAEPGSFRVVIAGAVTLSGLTPGARYYRQPDGSVGTGENGPAILTAVSAGQAVLAIGGGGSGAGGAAISVWSARAVKKDELVITSAGSWFRALQDHNSATEPTQGSAWWEKLPERDLSGYATVTALNAKVDQAGVRATPLTGYAQATTAADLAATDTILAAFGKLQKRITDNIAALAGKADKALANVFTAVQSIVVSGATVLPFRVRNTTANPTEDLTKWDVGAENATVARVTAKGEFSGAGFIRNGRTNWVGVPEFDPASLLGGSDFPETEKAKLRLESNWEQFPAASGRWRYIGTPITNTHNLQEYEDTATGWWFKCTADNKWIRR